MLAGVGGRTVEEAKQRITYSEFLRWLAFRRQHGPIAPQLQQERIAAAQMLQFNKTHGGKGTFEDFMLWSKPEEKELTLDEAMAEWL